MMTRSGAIFRLRPTKRELKLGRHLRDEEGHAPEAPPAPPPPPAPEPEAPPEYVPLTAEALKFPEGVTVDDGLRDEFLAAFNNQELEPGARAQALLDLHLKTLQAASDQSSHAFGETQKQWQEQAKADPDIGGDKLEPALAVISKAIDKYGSPEFREVMDLTGAGNHPAMIKFIYNMAKQFEEGGPVQGTSAPAEGSLAERMYPSMKKEG